MTENLHPRFDFRFIDGMRGLAALCVVFLHASLFTGLDGDVASVFPFLAKALFLGNYAVAVFIVLSGFVLMLPIAKSPGLRLKHGTWIYLKRRAKRILPPYFASLFLFGVLILCVPVLQTQRGTAWDSKIPVTYDGVVAHILLVHNINGDWAYQINGPAWSIGTEWQLYFALPFIILPLWRMFGRVAALVATLTLSASIALFLPAWNSGHMWFLALFTMGALAAEAAVAKRPPGGTGPSLAITLLVAVLCMTVWDAPLWVNELTVGAAIALIIYRMSVVSMRGQRTFAHRVLESRPAVWLGLWSFSLYLIHSPILGLVNLLLLDIEMPLVARLAIQFGIAVPAAGIISYLFHVVVERRFITSHQGRSGIAPLSDALSGETTRPTARRS